MKPPIEPYFNDKVDPSAKTPIDTGLFNDEVHEDQIVVMYESQEHAQAALDALRAQGLQADATITDRTADGVNAGVNSEGGNTGLLGALKGLFAPDAEVHGFAEGVNRGHALLVVHPALETRRELVTLLEGTNPIDFDAKLELWRTAGWESMAADQAANAAREQATRRVGVRDITRGTATVRSYYAPRPGT